MMSNFLVRVELFEADGEKYELLHEKMLSIGFYRAIKSDGSVLKLPTGTYVGLNDNSSDVIRDSVKYLADPLSSGDASIFVCRYDDYSARLYPAT